MAKEVILSNIKEYDDYSNHDSLFAALEARSDALPEGEVLGALYGAPYADGKAWYVVVKEKPLTVANVPVWDAWQLPDAHVRGLNKADILADRRWNAHIKEAFAKQKAKV